jgi:hypothetical protein
MELMQLKMFRLVVEERSVLRAAERVLRTQPAVSAALKKLEEEIGVPLFDPRERRRYKLTSGGHLLYSYAVRLEQLEADTKAALEKVSAQERGLRDADGAGRSACVMFAIETEACEAERLEANLWKLDGVVGVKRLNAGYVPQSNGASVAVAPIERATMPVSPGTSHSV